MVRTTLARWGITHQVFKSALAASASYALAAHIFDHKFPVFAPMAALLTIQINVFSSVSRGIQRIVAIIVGIGVAMFAFHFTGANWWIIFIVVFITLMIGTRMGLGIAAINQVPMSALLILAAKAYVPTYALDRIVNTILGTLIAVLINSLLWPPDTLPQAKDAVTKFAESTAGLLRDAAEVLKQAGSHDHQTPPDLVAKARTVDKLAGQAVGAVTKARGSLKMNPAHKSLEPQLKRYQDLMKTLERAGVQARGIAKSVSELEQTNHQLPDTSELAEYLETAAGALMAEADRIGHLSAPNQTPSREAAHHPQELYDQLTRQTLPHLENLPEVWPRYGSILADANHMLRELHDAEGS